MKKILVFLLLITGLVKAQVVVPKSTTTFSNVVATGNATVNGTLKVNGTSTLSSTNINGTLSVGSSTAIGTSSLVQMYVTKGTSTVAIGEGSSGVASIWLNKSTPSSTNWSLFGSGTTTYLNDNSNLEFRINNAAKGGFATSFFYSQVNTRIGGSSTPSATLDVTGTMSVSSTATITGAAKQTNTLNYEGNTTWNTNQTNTLTTGNTGTIAVLSDAMYSESFRPSANAVPADATTYYFAVGDWLNWGTVAGAFNSYMPRNVTIIAMTVNWYINGAGGSAETFTVGMRINGVNTNLTTSMTATNTGANTFTVTGLSTNIDAGVPYEPFVTTPTWVTNPATSYPVITFYYVRRQ